MARSKRSNKAALAGLCLVLGFWSAAHCGESAPGQILQGEGKGSSHSRAQEAGKPGLSLAWRDEEQKKACEKLAQEVRQHFIRAREFSIQGDACSSEAQARAFREGLEKIKGECPQGFAEQSGFSPKVVKNVRALETLGRERCAQPAAKPERGLPGR